LIEVTQGQLVEVHEGNATVNGRRTLRVAAAPGSQVRVRVVNSDNGRRPGFVRDVPGLWWSVNGHLYPLHLHGHHAVVLARDGVRAPPAARDGSTPSTSRTAPATTSPSSPTDPVSAWAPGPAGGIPARPRWFGL
jgi:FtsP/CotA-like multicopper oxidase with cupredoxin domain